MKTHSRLRDLLAALAAFSLGVFAYFRRSARKKEEARYCAICQLRKRPLGRVSFMVRTGGRRGVNLEMQPSPVMELHVCASHHPDKDVDGADLAHETQEFLLHHKVSAACTYYYKTPEHVFRLG